MFKETALHEVNHRAKNTLQVAASLLSVHRARECVCASALGPGGQP